MRDRIFQSPFFLSLTVGVPFCLYKILFGILAVRIEALDGMSLLAIPGWLIIMWATADLILNLSRALLDLSGIQDQHEYCTLAQLGRMFQLPELFLALDTLITFLIISFVLWSGWIIHLTLFESYMWYFATALNLISLSLVSFWTELVRARQQKART
ncbi:MAG TPA: hypothetical protein VN372_13965 [Methanospirillum sp.]|nr:hypothetical protein [Methanospirillum sp.]